MTDANWPNPERPGVPMFPERDGVHVIKWGNSPALKWDNNPASTCGFEIWEWDRAAQKWNGIEPKGMINEGYSYISPLLTPTQISDMLAGERERAVSACLSQKEVFESPEYAGGPLGAVMERFACDRCIEEIRNLGAAS